MKTVNYVEILFMVISIISLGISAVSIFWTIKTKNRYEKYVKKLGNGSNIAEALDEYIKQVENIEKRDDQILEYCTALNAELGRCIKKIGIVRYDMFENYSFGDLLSNIYKKRILNLIAFLLLSIALVCPLVLQTINKKTITKEGVQYSTYVAYKITAPESDNINALYSRRGYSDFYEKLLVSNLNGAYLFNDVSDKDLSKMAKELDTSAVTLKNSNVDYWDKKVVVNYISTNLGVSAKILTPSKAVNDVIEKKFDELINKYKSVYKNVTIEKVESNYSKELSSKENVNTGYSMKKLLVKVFAIEVALIILVAIMNFVMYIFDPTINREGDYRKYNIKFVQEIKNNNDLLEVLKYKINNENIEELSILSSNSKIIDKLNDLNIDKVNIVKTNDLSNIMNLKNVILVEEYGITRYSAFEKLLQNIKNYEKNIIGVLSYKL